MLNSAIGILFYYLLPNHLVWQMLSQGEKKIILDACYLHNNTQYARIQDYDSEHNRTLPAKETKEGKIVQYVLKKYSPSSVLEVGPGNGLYSRLILDYPSVKEYTAIDIVEPCINYIRNNVLLENEHSKTELICGDLLAQDFNNKKFSLIIFISSLHHIPYRTEVVKKCVSLLNENGYIVFIEARHGIPRILLLLRKFIKYYHKKEYWLNREHLSTHHSLTLLEIRHIAAKCKLRILELFFFTARGERYFKCFLDRRLSFSCWPHFIPLSLFSQYVYVSFSKTKGTDA